MPALSDDYHIGHTTPRGGHPICIHRRWRFTRSGEDFMPPNLPRPSMSAGYVLVDVEPGSEYSVFEQASALPFVSDAQILFGDHDMILKIEAESMGEIARLVVDSVRPIEGITNTKTLACAEL
ncbi:MAG: hypothetical protein CMA54_02275 [Euryarchaeota archaeon]|nr:hypothetical protein [Euryarchaeota archaeon]